VAAPAHVILVPKATGSQDLCVAEEGKFGLETHSPGPTA